MAAAPPGPVVVTPIRLRRAGRLGVPAFTVLAFMTLALAWVKVADGTSFIGFDLSNIADDVPDAQNALTQLFLEIAPLPAYVALLLSPTVAVRARWARITGTVLAVLAAALTAVVAMGLYSEIESWWPADRADRHRVYAVAVGLLAVLLLVAAGLLAVDRRGPYHALVAGVLLGSAAFQFGNVAVLQGRETGAVTVTLAPWATGLGYLLAGLCVVMAAVGYARSTPDRAATRADAGMPIPPWEGAGPDVPRDPGPVPRKS
jgi:hypothetical protein